MNRYMIIMALMLMTATSVLTACGTDDEPIIETPVTPVPEPEGPEDDDNSENGNDNGSDNNENNGEENEMSKNITVRIGDYSFLSHLRRMPQHVLLPLCCL